MNILNFLAILGVVCSVQAQEQTCSGGCFNASSCERLNLPISRGSCRENRVCCGVTCPVSCSATCFGSSNGRCPGSTTPASGSCQPGAVCCRNLPPPPPPPPTCSGSCVGSGNAQCPSNLIAAKGSCAPGGVCCKPR